MFSGSVAAATVIGLVGSTMLLGGFGPFAAVGLVAGGIAVVLLLSLVGLLTPTLDLLILLSLWLAAGVVLVADHRGAALMVTHLMPVAVTFVGRWSLRALELALRVPLFVPAALVIVTAPLLTEDPWHFVAAAKGRLALLALLTIVPLLALVLVRLRRVRVRKVFERAAVTVAENADAAVARGVVILHSRCLTRESWPDSRKLDRYQRQAFAPNALRGTAADLAELVASGFRRQCAVRLCTLLLGVLAITFALIYTLAVAAMPVQLAEAWSGTRMSYVVLEELGLQLPLWPYAGVAVLFAVVAAVGFLAFAITEETYTTSLVDAVHGTLAEKLIVVGAPYLFHGRGPSTSAAPAAPAEERPKKPMQVYGKRRR